MTRNVIWQDHEPALQPVDETVDHVRGSPAGRLILEYGDYECPYSRPPCSGRGPMSAICALRRHSS